MNRAFVALCACVATAASACGDNAPPPAPNIRPVIESLDVADRATVMSDGRATLKATVVFHDDDNGVAEIAFRVPASRSELRTQSGVHRRAAAQLTLQFGGVTGEPIEYEIVVIDTAGAESLPEKRTVTLE